MIRSRDTHKEGKEALIASYSDIAHISAELAVTIGLIDASQHLDDAWPEEVKGNFQEKVDMLSQHLQNELVEFMAFGQALDERED